MEKGRNIKVTQRTKAEADVAAVFRNVHAVEECIYARVRAHGAGEVVWVCGIDKGGFNAQTAKAHAQLVLAGDHRLAADIQIPRHLRPLV